MKKRLAILAAFALTAASIFAYDTNAPDAFVVTGAHIFTGTGEVLENGSIAIDDGLVVSIGAVGESVEAPEGAWVIDATGKNVYPGFIDALGTLGLGKPRENGDDGEAPPRGPIARGPEDRPATTPFRSAADELQLGDDRLEKWRSAGFTSAVTVPAEGIFPGQASFINLAGERERDMVVATPVALRVNLEPPDRRRSFPGSLMGVLAYVQQAFADAAHYRAAWTAYEADPKGKPRPTYDRALAPLAEAQAEGWPVLFPATLAHEIDRALGLAEDAGVTPVLYGVHQGYAAAERLAEARVPVLVNLDWPSRDEDADPEEEIPLRVLELWDRAPSTPAALEKAGVRFGLYSGEIEKPEEVLANARKAVSAGLSKERAIRALSLDAAAIFGLDDRVGSLEPGKIANFFIADGDVLEEGTRIETMFVDGRKLEIRETTEEEKETDEGGKR